MAKFSKIKSSFSMCLLETCIIHTIGGGGSLLYTAKISWHFTAGENPKKQLETKQQVTGHREEVTFIHS